MARQSTFRPPALAAWLLGQMTGYRQRHSVLIDFEETFREIAGTEGTIKAHAWYWKDALQSVFPYWKKMALGDLMMIANYFKMAYRAFRRQKLFSLINIMGLAIGLATCMLIGLWVSHEFSYDRFHEKAHRIYRIERELFRDNAYSRWPIVGGRYLEALLGDIPEIENATRMWRQRIAVTDHQGETHQQALFMTDNAIFEMFDFKLLQGDAKTALTEPMSVVMTESLALQYFGRTDILGETLILEDQGVDEALRVTGILADVPENSSMRFEMLGAISSYPAERFSSWRSNYLYTFIQVRKNTPVEVVNAKLKRFVEAHLEAHYGDLTSQGLGIHEVLRLYAYPLLDIYLHPAENWEMGEGGSAQSVAIFMTIAILILIIACINFMNLSMARANQRAKEVCLRKTVGAGRGQLRRQFLQESVVLSGLALMVALLICVSVIPLCQRFFGETLSVRQLFHPIYLLVISGMTLLAGVLAGLYPAYYLTRFEPASLGRGLTRSGQPRSRFRRNLVIAQFVIASALIVCLVTVYRQMQYIQNRSLGFNRDNMVLVRADGQQMAQRYDALKKGLLESPLIQAMTKSLDVPGEDFYSNSGFRTRQMTAAPANLLMIFGDYDFSEVYEIPLVAGRRFSREFASDTVNAIMVNVAAAHRLGLTPEAAIGHEIRQGGGDVYRIIGVLEDFHLRSLHMEVEPLALLLRPRRMNRISIRIDGNRPQQALRLIRSQWETVCPDMRFEYTFLDQQLARLYEREEKMQKFFVVFCVFSVIVACLGLLGLAAFTAQVRSKEVGIRKALGGSTLRVMLLLTGTFMRWILVANLMAWPIGWLVMRRWLQDFVYRTTMGVEAFAGSALLSGGIALLTVGLQVMKTARQNPADVLRLE